VHELDKTIIASGVSVRSAADMTDATASIITWKAYSNHTIKVD